MWTHILHPTLHCPPSARSMIPNVSKSHLSIGALKRVQKGGDFPAQDDSFRLMLSDLPRDVLIEIINALQRDNYKVLDSICRISLTFRDMCASESFWELLLRWNHWGSEALIPLFGSTYKECYQTLCLMGDNRMRCHKDVLVHPNWAPTWNSGLLLGRWYVMVCGMSDVYRSRLLAWNSETKVIHNGTFNGCTPLTLKLLPPNVKMIGPDAFKHCTSLDSMALPPDVIYIGSSAFKGCTSLALRELPPDLRFIEPSAFENCTSLTLTTIPSGPKTIGCSAFKNCTSLTLTKLPSTLKCIHHSAFRNCTSLALTALPPDLTTIQDGAFAGCGQLKNTDVGRAILQLNPRAFDS
jgi:hypothetical protein